MNHEGIFKSHDGLDFFERHWQADGDARADLVLLHGYCEHSGRYAHVAGALNGIGINVHAYDQRGHGRSAGQRGYIRRFDDLLDDLDHFIGHIGSRLGNAPLFMMGHSMGGLVLVHYVATRKPDVRGLVFSSPFLAINDDVSPVVIALAGVLGNVTPWLPVARLDSAGIARDPDVVRAYDTDPLIHHGKILARTGHQLNTAIARAQTLFEAVAAPVYIIHGTDDPLVPAEGSRLLYERCRSEDKMYHPRDGGYHELLNDYEKESVLAELCDWLRNRL